MSHDELWHQYLEIYGTIITLKLWGNKNTSLYNLGVFTVKLQRFIQNALLCVICLQYWVFNALTFHTHLLCGFYFVSEQLLLHWLQHIKMLWNLWSQSVSMKEKSWGKSFWIGIYWSTKTVVKNPFIYNFMLIYKLC